MTIVARPLLGAQGMIRASALSALLILAACDTSSNGTGPFSPSNPGPPGGDELCGDRPGGQVGTLEILRYESADRDTIVQISRAYESPGVGHSTIYRLEELAIFTGGAERCSTAASELGYDNSHHNWADTARATIDGVRYELRHQFGWRDGAGWNVSLTGTNAAGFTVLEESALTATGMPVLCWGCPGFVPVFVSELMPNNQTGLADEAGEREPWIELFNPAAEAVDLTGWSLSDDFGDRRKWTFGSDQIGRHETIVLFADGDTAQGPRHLSFELDPAGGALVLTTADGRTTGGFTYPAHGPDEALGYTYSVGGYTPLTPTPGQQNPD